MFSHAIPLEDDAAMKGLTAPLPADHRWLVGDAVLSRASFRVGDAIYGNFRGLEHTNNG